MKILYVHQYFITPSEAGGTRTYWISLELIKNGHQVTMITTNRGQDKPKRTNIDGIEVIYLNIPYSNKMNIAQRLGSFVKFMVLSSYHVLKESSKHNLLISTSTPLTVGFPALVGKKIKGLPYIFEVRDLWPEVPIQMGAVKNKIIQKLLRWFEKTIYKNSKHVVALSPGMSSGVIEAGTPVEKVTTIPNMSKIDKFWSREKKPNFLKELNLRQDTFKVIYFGSMGIANGMDYIINAIKHLKDEKDIEFMFLGGGATEPVLKKKCEDEGLFNTRFYGRVAMDRLSEIVNVADVSLITFSDLPILATNSPNKLFDSLSAGKPVIVNSPGWTKKMVEDYKCGAYANPKDSKDLASTILKFKNDSALCKEMGENSRKLAEEKFDKSILCDEYVKLVERVSAK